MSHPENQYLSPWVGRLMAVHTGVLVLLLTVFTAPAISSALQFDPATALARPWTIFTHLFVHRGPLHLATSLLVLWVFAPTVERRLGGRRFLLLYLSCGLGAAFLGAGLHGMSPLPPLSGAGGAALGIALVYALTWPDSEMAAFPSPVPLSPATVVGVLVALDLLAAIRFGADGVASFAHLGGLAAGYLGFRFRRLGPEQPTVASRGVLRPVMATQLPYRLEERAAAAAPPPPPPPRPEPAAPAVDVERVEMDRVLDKISSTGLASLTVSEQRFLEDVAERKKGGG